MKRLDQIRVPRSAAVGSRLAILALSACGDASQASSQSGAPTVPARESPAGVDGASGADEASASSDDSTSGETAGADRTDDDGANEARVPASEGADPAIDFVGEEVDDPVGGDDEPEAGDAENADDPPDSAEPAQPIPGIAPPGFPAGAPARLVPMQFDGPITGLPVSFNAYLPPGYDSGSASYPVLYDLHGLTDSRDTNPGPVTRSLEAAMRSGVVGPMIVIFPQSFIEAYYADTYDGARPGETQVMRELIPFVDQTFRTLAHRARRGVSGFSMGGFGALAYATKHPDAFSIGIGYDSALDTWETLVGRRAYIAAAAFGNDESRFDQVSPWANAERNAAELTQSMTLRIVPGTQYRAFNEAFRDHLTALGVPHEFTLTDCPHDYGCLIDRAGARSWAMLQAEFSQPATAP